MSGWGIADTASEIEKIKAESADYLRGLNSCCLIDWNTYDKAFDFYMGLIDASYEQGKKDAEQRWIPCTPDTMPKPMQKVLITFEEYDQLWVTSAKFIYYRKTLQWDWDFGSCGEVKAWMPLPEPYGGK